MEEYEHDTLKAQWGELYDTLQEMKRNGDEIQDPLFSKAFILFDKLEEANDIQNIWQLLDEANFTETEINRINSPCLDGLYACRKYKKFGTFLAKHIDKYYETLILVFPFMSQNDAYGMIKVLCKDTSTINFDRLYDFTFEICGYIFEYEFAKIVHLACEWGSYDFVQGIRRLLKEDCHLYHYVWRVCEKGHFDILQYLYEYYEKELKKPNKIISINEMLTIVCRRGYYDMAVFLVEKGANVNHTYRTTRNILVDSIVSGNIDIVKFLINNGALITSTVLDTAIECQQYDILKFLLDCGTSIESVDFGLALKYNNPDIIELLLKKGIEVTVEHIYSHDIYIPIVDIMLKHGFNIHFHNDQLLQQAVVKGDIITSMALVDRGASPNKGLVSAATCGKTYFFPLFLERGANNYKKTLSVSQSNRVRQEFTNCLEKFRKNK